MNRRQAISAFGALSAGLWVASWSKSAAADAGLVVVVHPSNPVDALSEGELEAIFTTRQRNFRGGRTIVPFNLPPRQEDRVAFDRAILRMDPDEVARYWIDRRVRGGAKPPRQVPNAELLVKVVERLEGAIGYAPESLVSPHVKVVARV